VADAYRDAFVDLDDLARTIGSLGRFDTAIEVGCGEGALATRLTRTTDATILGIDIAPNPGRGYEGATGRASFRQQRVEDLVAEGATADLVVLSDVIHHVPPADRPAFLRSCVALVARGGLLAVKEWERRSNAFHALAYGSDRYVSGDRGVSFLSRDELVALLGATAPALVSVCETRIPPRRNNLLVALRA
jgi:ubiquinone/menaquinone biosynthesis C-methylase UbiE